MCKWCFLLLFFVAFPGSVFADLPAKRILGQSYLSLKQLEDKGLGVYFDQTKERLLIQGIRGHTAFLLPHASHALVDGVFGQFPQPLVQEKEIFYVANTFVEQRLSEFFPDEKRGVVKNSVMDNSCIVGRPVKKVFIDPGHGGSDLGTGFEGVYEKHIVLRFAKLAAAEMRKAGIQVSFSRTKDIFLPLDIRSELAKKWGADLFISIHVNSSPIPSVHGTETYILSADSTDAEARKLALKENSVSGEMPESKGILKDILWDMEQTAYLQSSAHLAAFLQKSVVNSNSMLQNRGVRQAPFFVLSRAAMPAVLVELGYLSNNRDRDLLTNTKFQENLAKALARGVKMYKDACKAR